MRILAGIDLPNDLVCGSLLLAQDLYAAARGRGDDVRFAVLPGLNPQVSLVAGAIELSVAKPASTTAAYIDELARALKSELGTWTPDIIHCHHMGYGMSPALQLLFPSKPILGLVHGTDIFDAIYDADVRQQASSVLERCDLVVFPSVALASQALSAGLTVAPSRTCVVPWGVPPSIVAPRRTSSQGDDVHRLLVASRLTANKDVATVLHALSILPDSFVLDIIGEGRELLALEVLAKDLELLGRVRFLSMRDRKKLWRDMAEYDLAVFATAELEAFGLFGVECQVQGLPLLTSDLSVFDEIFGASAERFSAADPVSLRDAVSRIFASPTRLEELRILGLINASRFNIDRQTRTLLEIGDALVFQNHDKVEK